MARSGRAVGKALMERLALAPRRAALRYGGRVLGLGSPLLERLHPQGFLGGGGRKRISGKTPALSLGSRSGCGRVNSADVPWRGS